MSNIKSLCKMKAGNKINAAFSMIIFNNER